MTVTCDGCGMVWKSMPGMNCPVCGRALAVRAEDSGPVLRIIDREMAPLRELRDESYANMTAEIRDLEVDGLEEQWAL